MIRNTLPGLDYALGSDVDILRETVGSFAQAKIAPRADDIDRSNKFPRDLWPELGALGLLFLQNHRVGVQNSSFHSPGWRRSLLTELP